MKETPLVVKNEGGKACLSDDKKDIICLNWVSQKEGWKSQCLVNFNQG